VGRLGILGGTFNPPHLGHRAVARHAQDELRLDRVLLMPAHIPPHKLAAEDPGPEHRLAMCRLLVEGEEGLSVCALEIERTGPSYSVDTLRAIHASHPDVELTFIVGADAARTLPSWREPAKLLELASLAVALRSGSAREQVLDQVASLAPSSGGGAGAGPVAAAGRSGTVGFLDMPPIEISSSMVRESVARGEPIEDLVGPAVAGYVAEHGLYRSATGAAD